MMCEPQHGKTKWQRHQYRGETQVKRGHVEYNNNHKMCRNQKSSWSGHVERTMNGPKCQRRCCALYGGTRHIDLCLQPFVTRDQSNILFNERTHQTQVTPTSFAGDCFVVEIFGAERTFHLKKPASYMGSFFLCSRALSSERKCAVQLFKLA